MAAPQAQLGLLSSMEPGASTTTSRWQAESVQRQRSPDFMSMAGRPPFAACFLDYNVKYAESQEKSQNVSSSKYKSKEILWRDKERQNSEQRGASTRRSEQPGATRLQRSVPLRERMTGLRSAV